MPKLNTALDNALLTKVMLNKELLIPGRHLSHVCKKQQGQVACRYICVSAIGNICVKNTPLKADIDYCVKNNKKWKAMGDNCSGIPYEEKEDQKVNENTQKSQKED